MVCPEGLPSADCGRCLCEGHVLQGEVYTIAGVPVAGATVALADRPKVALAQSDPAGRFRVPGVCSSSPSLLSVRKERFAAAAVSTSSNATGLSWVRAVLGSTGESQPRGGGGHFF
jgi:hypothetical protein